MKVSVAKVRERLKQELQRAEKEAATSVGRAEREYDRKLAQQVKEAESFLKQAKAALQTGTHPEVPGHGYLGLNAADTRAQNQEVHRITHALETLELCADETLTMQEADRLIGRALFERRY